MAGYSFGQKTRYGILDIQYDNKTYNNLRSFGVMDKVTTKSGNNENKQDIKTPLSSNNGGNENNPHNSNGSTNRLETTSQEDHRPDHISFTK